MLLCLGRLVRANPAEAPIAGIPQSVGSQNAIASVLGGLYLSGMAARPKSLRKHLAEVAWIIELAISGTSAKLNIGRVYALDQRTAIAKAIPKFGIMNPEHQRRLMAKHAGASSGSTKPNERDPGV
jgi:hypothetical protein